MQIALTHSIHIVANCGSLCDDDSVDMILIIFLKKTGASQPIVHIPPETLTTIYKPAGIVHK